MDKQEILALLEKYRQGKCSEGEIRKIHLWYESLNPALSIALSDQEKQLLEDKMLGNILLEKSDSGKEIPLSYQWWKSPALYSGIAACAVIAISYLLFFNPKSDYSMIQATFISHDSQTELVTKKNVTDHNQKIRLSDNSFVTLSAGSEMIYPAAFASDKREVQLKGNALFEISKNPAKPFFVYSGKLVTRVLGTSFRIKTNEENKALEVEVITGKVSVFENGSGKEAIKTSNNGVLLTPNQRVIYFAESGHLMTSIVDEPVVIEAETKSDFNNALLTDIIEVLHEEYGIEIVFANDRFRKCTFTGDISNMTLYEKLTLICKSNLAEYELKGTRILISGEGCD